ncbi:hypothetical protein [Microbacterium aerolatum]|uniref:Uncharacterized protein n=2 Tax=Microbacterium aerolatum TaxID=153731 RepID=A0A511AB69_9MICO|nr:hypothetical protein [Microbacterium aerolatum]GEK85428.1 hypothetical protein MAE01_06040 [Microbacterium aerolatum]GGB31021.1 hypothetical protein GCM10007198_21850 [Microbacterium aerolatum]
MRLTRVSSTGWSGAARHGIMARMWTILIVLLIVWAALSILGFVVKGLLWLALIGIILFLATLVVGFFRQKAGKD